MLCIISFIGSGLAFFTYTMISLSYYEFMTALEEMEFNMPEMEVLKQASKGFFISGSFLFGASLIGVWQMWKLRKSGFHFYTMAQVLISLQPWLFLKLENFPLVSVLTSVIFILLYGMHWKFLN